MSRLSKLFSYPYPLRLVVAQKIKSTLRGFSREHYFVCVQRAVREGLALGRNRMTVIEFGVAGGRGLIELENICRHMESRYPVTFDVFGFDTGAGLPKPDSYKDTPWKWQEGWYPMDFEKLRKQLKKAQLVIGNVDTTVPDFMANGLPSPIGAVMFDLDYYSSTMAAMRVFEHSDPALTLPRCLCYFDDLGSIEDVGVLRAIAEFNEAHTDRKIKPQLYWANRRDPYVIGWKIYEYHKFDHPDYQKPVRRKDGE